MGTLMGLAALCLVVLFTSCSRATPAPPIITPTATTVAAPPTAAVMSTKAVLSPDPNARYGGSLRLAAPEGLAHFDVHLDALPALSSWGPGLAYSRLLRFVSGPDVELPNLAVECDLCLRWTMEDDRAFVFELRPDVQWHDPDLVGGRTLSADDPVFSYERQRQPGAPNAALLGSVASFEAAGPLELRVTLAAPDADFMLGLADARSKVVAREAVAVTGDLRGGPTVGTGPWRLADAQDFAYTFGRNPDYFEEGFPYAETLQVNIVDDPEARDAAFRTSLLDIVEMEPQEWLAVREDMPDAQALFVKETGTGLEVGLNAARPPFDDLRVRRAVFLAQDPWGAIESVWLGAAYVSPGFPVADPSWLLERADLAKYFADPDAARRLLSKTGELESVTIRVGNYGEAYRAHAERLAEEMRDVGFDARVEVVNRTIFGDAVWLSGDYQMFVGPPLPVTAPNAYLLSVLHSGGAWNTGGIADAELDRLIEAQAAEYDPAARRDLIQRIERRMLDLAISYMPATRVSISVSQPSIRGFHPNFAGFEYTHWARVWIDLQP